MEFHTASWQPSATQSRTNGINHTQSTSIESSNLCVSAIRQPSNPVVRRAKVPSKGSINTPPIAISCLENQLQGCSRAPAANLFLKQAKTHKQTQLQRYCRAASNKFFQNSPTSLLHPALNQVVVAAPCFSFSYQGSQPQGLPITNTRF